ncbi:NUDIX domain-containing protein [Virgibacillus halophilus]|uniref:8-oxo-dGTP diphosphatase n=1 Tax=Tigheibacillus halophilus TaxID=361280 RepID=A0ABU5C5D7_9BACI|nr:8-oxo-dGTP diphosphatase [Virgibacillus halophilus]
MLKYTICFIQRGNQLLLLNREKSPNMGKWNGVGGKIEKNESPKESILREVSEETGIVLPTVTYAGNVIWKSNGEYAGMYVFLADLPSGCHPATLVKTREGILDWKEITWVLDRDNHGVVDNLKQFLPLLLSGHYGLEHIFFYQNHRILDYTTRPLPFDATLHSS